MTDPSDQRARSASAARARATAQQTVPAPPTDPAGSSPPAAAPAAAPSTASNEPVPLTRRAQPFMLAKRNGVTPQGVAPLQFDAIADALTNDPNCQVKKRLRPRGVMSTLSVAGVGAGELGDIIVAEMPRERATQLDQHPQLLVEPDHPLTLPGPVAPFQAVLRDPGVIPPQPTALTVTITVAGKDGRLVEGATVYLYGSVLPAQGVTDAQGRVELTMVGDSTETLRGLYVDPKADYWSLWVPQPAVTSGTNYLVTLAPLSEMLPNFPNAEHIGWGQVAMGLDRVPKRARGRGVKVGIIDSGAAAGSHPDLSAITHGFDNTQDNDTTWKEDLINHGSHCAGIIAGLDDGTGIRGFVPDAEVHVFKVFPGGRFSDLIEALDLCIEAQVDVVNMSLGSDERSELLEQKIRQAKAAGVACIVAAGNSSGPVQFPATSPDVLAVSAVGMFGRYPRDSYQATQDVAGGAGAKDGAYFSARFSCFGPEVGVAGPGVAIVSSVPPTNFAVMDGTSMATPHVTGAAALVLAHHADFKGPFRARNAARVDRLFEILKRSAQPLDLGDPNRTGAGIPNVAKALELVVEGSQTGPSSEPAEPPEIDHLRSGMHQAGLLADSGGPVGPQSAAATPSSPMDQLRSFMQQAGLLSNGGSQAGPQSAAPTEPVSSLDQLRARMEQTGLWPGAG